MRKIGIIKIFFTQIRTQKYPHAINLESFFQNFDPIMQPCIPSNFKSSISQQKLSFLNENQENDKKGGFTDFNVFTLYMIFEIFH